MLALHRIKKESSSVVAGSCFQELKFFHQLLGNIKPFPHNIKPFFEFLVEFARFLFHLVHLLVEVPPLDDVIVRPQPETG